MIQQINNISNTYIRRKKVWEACIPRSVGERDREKSNSRTRDELVMEGTGVAPFNNNKNVRPIKE